MEADLKTYEEVFPGLVELARANTHRRKLMSGSNAYDTGIYDYDTREHLGRVNNGAEAGIVIELHGEIRQRDLEG